MTIVPGNFGEVNEGPWHNFEFISNIDGSPEMFDAQAGYGVESWSPKRQAGAQGETRMMPGAANRFANQSPSVSGPL